MKEMIVEEESTLFNKIISLCGVIIGTSIIIAITMQQGLFLLGPIILGVLFMCVLLGYFFAKR